MYQNLDECLRDVYRFGALRLEPMGNTQQIMLWLENKGASGSPSGLSQAEWHANAAMIESQIAACLGSRLLVAVVECQYGKYDNLYYLANVLVANHVCDDVIFAATMLQHIYSDGKNPREVAILDNFDLARSTFWRKRDKVKKYIADLEQKARFKLQDDFCKKSIISA